MISTRAELRRCMLRARLMDELTQEGVHIALPTEPCGIDLIAYTPPTHEDSIIAAIPIQLVAMSFGTFLRDFAALRTRGLLVVLLEDAAEPQQVNIFALTAPELMLVQMIGLIDASASALRPALEPYVMVSGSWRSKISQWIMERQSSGPLRRFNNAIGTT
jgi:hypothetical protein